MGVQVHGGMGYIEETGAAQYLRDVRVTAIYEGTNGIQSMDLAGASWPTGARRRALLDEIAASRRGRTRPPARSRRAGLGGRGIPARGDGVDGGARRLNQRFAGAVPYLRAWARVLGAHFHLCAALAEGGEGPAHAAGAVLHHPAAARTRGPPGPCHRRGRTTSTRSRPRTCRHDGRRAGTTSAIRGTRAGHGGRSEIAAGVLWIRLPLPMALDHVNVYALDDGDSWTVVDTGHSFRRMVALWQGLLDGPLGGRPVGRVILTHHHPDHVGMAGWLMAPSAPSW